MSSFDLFPAGRARRDFIKWAGAACAVAAVRASDARTSTEYGIIDIHAHCTHQGRPDEDLLVHQKNTGAEVTVLLPAGSTGGLAAGAAGNEHVAALARRHPDRFRYFANENVFRPEAARTIERCLQAGACGIGELKDKIACDGPEMMRVAEVAREYAVPVLIHFQDGGYNDGFARFHRMLEKFPTVNFIGHATAFWGNIDKQYIPAHQRSIPSTLVPGGLTDRWLADYPNMFGDLSAGSGNRALSRDPGFTKDFITRHQNKLMYGSDCFCATGAGAQCLAVIKLGLLRQLCASEAIRRKVLRDNARKLLRLDLATRE